LLFAWLAAASQVLGWLQVGAAQDSLVNPFPRWPLAFNGLFANPNHQGTAAALSVVAMVALASSGNPVDAGYWRSRRLPCGLALLALASLPMTGSRAALLLAIAGAVAALVLLGFETRGPRSGGRLRAGWAAVVLAMVAFAVAWVRFQAADAVRWGLVQTTAAMAWAYAPTGAGVGSFVPVFDQYAPRSLMQWEFFNHAHDEYVQWWFESGVAGMAVVAFAVWLLVRSRPRPRAKYQGEAVAAWVGCITLLLHSLVDYPLRTPALMAVAALLAGTMVAAARPNAAGAGR
jgi:O-antigen ligase